jgi:ADP-heptose:LPS heptosyltransferase
MNILVIRRDNIGDLICTTPLFSALRRQWPQAWIGVLANSYNAPILEGNPDLDAVFAYRKAKHREAGESRLAIWSETARLLWQLRRQGLDMVLCASPGATRFARLIGARRIVEAKRTGAGHEVEIVFRLMAELGLQATPGPLVLHSDASRRAALCARLGLPASLPRCTALHLSARKPLQRWPAERFASLARKLLQEGLTERILLFWAPGAADDPLHPGDDAKAEQVLKALHGLPVTPVPTHTLGELIAGLSLAATVVCSDGGAMHVAAGLGKPIVCFFGNSSAQRWHPWGVDHELLQPASGDVAELGVDTVCAAFVHLQTRTAGR